MQKFLLVILLGIISLCCKGQDIILDQNNLFVDYDSLLYANSITIYPKYELLDESEYKKNNPYHPLRPTIDNTFIKIESDSVLFVHDDFKFKCKIDDVREYINERNFVKKITYCLQLNIDNLSDLWGNPILNTISIIYDGINKIILCSFSLDFKYKFFWILSEKIFTLDANTEYDYNRINFY